MVIVPLGENVFYAESATPSTNGWSHSKPSWTPVAFANQGNDELTPVDGRLQPNQWQIYQPLDRVLRECERTIGLCGGTVIRLRV